MSELETDLAVVRMHNAVPGALVCEKINEGELAGALIFYIRFQAVPDAKSYNLSVYRNQNSTSDGYEILCDSANSDSNSVEFLTVRHVEGPNSPDSAFRRGKYIYYRFLTTSSGPSSPYGSTDREAIANIHAAYHNGTSVTIVVVK